MEKLPSITEFPSVIDSFKELLEFNDENAIRVILAAIIANELPTDPVWLMIVAPSSSAKSELVNSLDGMRHTHMLSSLTLNTFLSGYGSAGGTAKKASLLHRMDDEKKTVLLMKDFTTILSMRLDTRMELLAQFRELFDGRLTREFGNGKSQTWEGKMGLIAGVTYEIERSMVSMAKLGDRFIYYKLPAVDEEKLHTKLRSVMGREKVLRNNIKEAVTGFYYTLKDRRLNKLIEIPEEVANAIWSLCRLTMRLRGVVIRDSYGNKDIEAVMPAESPSRMYKQIMALGQGLVAMRGGTWCDDDYATLAKIALDAAPSWRVDAFQTLYQDAQYRTPSELADMLDRPTKAVRVVLDDLRCFELVERFTDKEDNNAHKYRPTALARKLAAYTNSCTPVDPTPELPNF